MNPTFIQVLLPMILLGVVVAVIAVRSIGALCSRRVRESVRRHPVAHALWLAGTLVAVLILLAWLFPHFANRPVRGAGANEAEWHPPEKLSAG